jgi:hypothetical protein
MAARVNPVLDQPPDPTTTPFAGPRFRKIDQCELRLQTIGITIIFGARHGIDRRWQFLAQCLRRA